MKKICFIGFDLFLLGGREKVTISLCNNLREFYEIHILSLCKIVDEKPYFIHENIAVHTFNMPSNMRVRESIRCFNKLKNFLKEEKIDVLFISGILPVPLLKLIKPFVDVKIVFCDHENIVNRDKKTLLIKKIACQISDKIVVLTNQTKEDYINKFNIEEKKFECIYNYIDDQMFNHSLRCDLNSQQIISVGRISSEKGFDLAVEAAKLIFERHKDWQWHIYGDGSDYDIINQKIKAYELEKFMILKGMTNCIQEKYQDYSICVLPSYREGLPLVLLEAKCNRLPIVSFDCPTGPSEIVRDGIDGYLVACYDVQKLADKICALIENKDIRQSFSDRSQENLAQFSKEKIMKQWVALIENL